jgi:hypothetical protein
MMTRVFVEHRKLASGVTLTWDMAHHLYARYAQGSVVIVADNPLALLAALRKQWLKVVMKLRNEYSRSLSGPRKTEVKRVFEEMLALPFILQPPTPESSNHLSVYVLQPAQLLELTTMHASLYITCQLPEGLDPRTLVEDRGMVVDYYAPTIKKEDE